MTINTDNTVRTFILQPTGHTINPDNLATTIITHNHSTMHTTPSYHTGKQYEQSEKPRHADKFIIVLI